MKKTSWKVALLLLMFCLLFSGSAFAAGKKGLVKSGGKYYYYQSGRRIKNKWKSVKVNGVTYRFYFGSNSAAYSGKKAKPAIKKIQGATYAFDENAHMIKGVVFIEKKFDSSLFCYVGNFYVFGKNGKLNKGETKKLQALYKKVIRGARVPAEEFQKVLAKYGEKVPLNTYFTGQGCDPGREEGYFQYAHVVFAMHRDIASGRYFIDGFRKYLSMDQLRSAAAGL